MNNYLACVDLKNFLLAVALKRAPSQAKGTAILFDQAGPQGRIVAVADRCEAAGVVPGMSEQEARVLFPSSSSLYLDLCAVEEASLALLTDFETFSPTIEWIDSGVALLDLGVIANANKARAIASRLITLLSLRGYQVGIGLAETRFVAHIAAQITSTGSSLLVPAAEHKIFLANQSLKYLPAPAETLRRLALLGIRTLGELAQFSVNALADQFGSLGVQLAALARGEEIQILNGIKLQEAFTETVEFESPISDGEFLTLSLKNLLEQMFHRLRERGQLTTRVRVTFFLDGVAKPSEVVLALAAPHRQVERLWNPLKNKLSSLQLSDQISQITVCLEGLVGEYARQLVFDSLFPKERRWQGIERVIERLRTKEEPPSLMRLIWDSPSAPVPERRAHLQDRVLPKRTRGLYALRAIEVSVDANENMQFLPRYVRSGPRWIAVEHILETWKVEDDWWSARPLLRTYYRIVLHNGVTLRIFRDGMTGNWYRQNGLC